MPGLEDLYREIILDHYRSPRNRGELEAPPATRVEGFNPLCGDEIVLYLDVADGVVRDVRVGGQGCSISQSSASMLSSSVNGKTIDDIRNRHTSFKAVLSLHESSPQGVQGVPTRDPVSAGHHGPPPAFARETAPRVHRRIRPDVDRRRSPELGRAHHGAGDRPADGGPARGDR